MDISKLNRIVGGIEVEPHGFPWMVQLQVKVGSSSGTCGGTLISPHSESKTNLVLTAAHCVVFGTRAVNPKDVKVVVGGHDMNKNEEGRQIVNVKEILTDNYESRTQHNDIALLVLENKVPFSEYTLPVCMNDKKSLPQDQTCLVLGWGATEKKGIASPKLRAVQVEIQNENMCKLPHFNTDKQFCAGNLEGGRDSCQGDSGGPLICTKDGEKFTQYGVISYGIGCGAPGQPGYYTRLSAYSTWVSKMAKKHK